MFQLDSVFKSSKKHTTTATASHQTANGSGSEKDEKQSITVTLYSQDTAVKHDRKLFGCVPIVRVVQLLATTGVLIGLVFGAFATAAIVTQGASQLSWHDTLAGAKRSLFVVGRKSDGQFPRRRGVSCSLVPLGLNLRRLVSLLLRTRKPYSQVVHTVYSQRGETASGCSHAPLHVSGCTGSLTLY